MNDHRWITGRSLELARRIKYGGVILRMPGQRKHLLRWLRSAGESYLLDAPSPWMTFDAIEVLDAYLHPGMRVFEYGSGGSTLFWVKKGAEVVSIEHDPAWFEAVREHLRSVPGVDYRLVEPEAGTSGTTADPGDPGAYASEDERYRGKNFRRYVTQIDTFPEETFDLVSIDGRARPSCVMHAAPRVKPGGLLVLDNAERSYYLAETRAFLTGFREQSLPGVLPSTRHVSQTNIYTRLSRPDGR